MAASHQVVKHPRSKEAAHEVPRAPLHSIEAEQAVLGSLLIDAGAWPRVQQLVAAADFYRPDHRLIFATIGELVDERIALDVITVCARLQRAGRLDEAGGMGYIGQLARDTATAANVADYARIVRDRAVLRRVLDIAGSIERSLADNRGVDEILLDAGEALERLRSTVRSEPVRIEPLPIEPVSSWGARPPPAARDWVIDGLIPAGRVSSLLGNGGLGKTIVAAQIGLHVAAGRDLFGQRVAGGPVLGIFCEDEQDEIERRVRAACAGENLELSDVERFRPLSREGEDNILCSFERDRIQLTPFYAELEATISEYQPRLVILDTAADLFAGDFMSTPHVRQFIKMALGGLCKRHGCAVLLIAHPSASGMSSGDGGGYSVAWSNSVRSRLYLRRPKSEDEESRDRRVLEVRKSNYGPDGTAISLIYRNGYFAPDEAPVEELARPLRAPKVDTRLAIAVMEYMRNRASSGSVVNFGALFEHLQTAGELPKGTPEAVRKKVQRALKDLVTEGMLKASEVPRGYRLAESSRDKFGTSSGQTQDTDTLGTSGHSGHPFGEGGCPVPNVPNRCPERECPEFEGGA